MTHLLMYFESTDACELTVEVVIKSIEGRKVGMNAGCLDAGGGS